MTLRFSTCPGGLVVAVVTLFACAPPAEHADAPADDASADATTADADPAACPAGPAGAACVLDLADQAIASCAPALLDRLEGELAARRGWLPLWAGGRALFASSVPASVAGAFAAWAPTPMARACDRELYLAIADVPTGRYPYKLIVDGQWQLDPQCLAFAFDDFAGNTDGANSLLDTPDSGLGELIAFAEPLCSEALGNCRRLTAYLPRGYRDPANAGRRYPVIYMHDGQNVWDDHDCCFGHTGWEVNVTLDADIAAGRAGEVIVVAADHGGADRNAEYGFTAAAGGRMETFMAFQVGAIQPAAEAVLRIDPDRRFVAGSSLGGLVSVRLAVAYPGTYVGVASLSGAFWPGQDTGTALRDALAASGAPPVAIYLDHGGTAASGADGYADNIEVRDLLVDLGASRADSPACAVAPAALCYHHEVGATHDELAWRDRAWRFLRLFASP